MGDRVRLEGGGQQPTMELRTWLCVWVGNGDKGWRWGWGWGCDGLAACPAPLLPPPAPRSRATTCTCPPPPWGAAQARRTRRSRSQRSRSRSPRRRLRWRTRTRARRRTALRRARAAAALPLMRRARPSAMDVRRPGRAPRTRATAGGPLGWRPGRLARRRPQRLARPGPGAAPPGRPARGLPRPPLPPRPGREARSAAAARPSGLGATRWGGGAMAGRVGGRAGWRAAHCGAAAPETASLVPPLRLSPGRAATKACAPGPWPGSCGCRRTHGACGWVGVGVGEERPADVLEAPRSRALQPSPRLPALSVPPSIPPEPRWCASSGPRTCRRTLPTLPPRGRCWRARGRAAGGSWSWSARRRAGAAPWWRRGSGRRVRGARPWGWCAARKGHASRCAPSELVRLVLLRAGPLLDTFELTARWDPDSPATPPEPLPRPSSQGPAAASFAPPAPSRPLAPLRSLDIFAGCGGLSAGFHAVRAQAGPRHRAWRPGPLPRAGCGLKGVSGLRPAAVRPRSPRVRPRCAGRRVWRRRAGPSSTWRTRRRPSASTTRTLPCRPTTATCCWRCGRGAGGGAGCWGAAHAARRPLTSLRTAPRRPPCSAPPAAERATRPTAARTPRRWRRRRR
jgi:hypothetical protein